MLVHLIMENYIPGMALSFAQVAKRKKKQWKGKDHQEIGIAVIVTSQPWFYLLLASTNSCFRVQDKWKEFSHNIQLPQLLMGVCILTCLYWTWRILLVSLPIASELEVGRSKLELFAFYKSVSDFKITVVLVYPKDPLKALIHLCFSVWICSCAIHRAKSNDSGLLM